MCVGDVVYFVLFYVVYGMGMVIEDGYFFVCVLGGKDLSDVI